MFCIPVFVFTSLFIVLLFKYRSFRKRYEDINKLPGPKPYPIIGNILEFGNSTVLFLANVKRLNHLYGPGMYKYYLGPVTPRIAICQPEHVQAVLGSVAHVQKSDAYDSLKIWLGEGLLLSKADKWRNRRKLLTPAFHFKINEDAVSIVEHCASVLVRKLEKFHNSEINIHHLLSLFALDVICESSMGIKIDAQNALDLSYVKSIKGFLGCLIERFFSILKRNDTLAVFTDVYKTQQNHVQILKGFVRDAIKKRKEERENMKVSGRKIRRAFLDILLDMGEQDELSDEDIREEVDTFMFAGHDTISTTLALILYNLAKHPEVQQKLRDEIHNSLRDIPSVQDISKLKYMDCVIKESMRIHTVSPMIERELGQDIVIDNIRIPAKTPISIMIGRTHMLDEYYEDPSKFDPGRFFPENCVGRHPYAYIPFSAGPRNCIGQRFAMIVMKASLAKIIPRFEICHSASKPLVLGLSAILHCPNGIHVKIKNIQ